MNAQISPIRRDEKLGAAALVVATVAVLIWGQFGPQEIIRAHGAVSPRATVESESKEVRPVTLREVDSPRLQSRASTPVLPSA